MLLLIQCTMWCSLFIYILLALLIVVSNTLWQHEAILSPLKKILVLLMSVLYQGRAMFSYVVVLNIIFEMVGLIFLIKMEETKSMPEILY